MIKKMYYAILPAQIFMMLMMNINSIIDSFFAGNFLTTEELSAIGFYSPVSNLVYLCYVLITGTQILCCQHIGKGQKEETASLFTTSGVVIVGYGIAVSMIFLFMGPVLSSIMGASGQYAYAFQQYLIGLSFGIPFAMMNCYFMCFFKINDRNDLVIVSMVCAVVLNTVLNFLFVAVWHKGILGLAIASSLTSIVVTVIGVFGFLPNAKKDLAITFDLRMLDFKKLPAVIKNGMTQFSFNVAIMINNVIVNYVLILAGGERAVALMTVFNTFNMFISVLNAGTQESQLSIGSIYYGMRDRSSFIRVFRMGNRLITIMFGGTYLLVFLFAGVLSSIYFEVGSEMYSLAVIMLRIAMLYLFPIFISDTLLTAYQCQSKTKFPNAMQYIRTVLRLAPMALMASLIGLNGVWVGMVVGSVVQLIITYAHIFYCKGRITFRLEDGLLLDDDFGVPSECVFEKNVLSLDEAVRISEQVEAFCQGKNVSHRDAYHMGLCCEELVSNIYEHGTAGKNTVTLYLVIEDNYCSIQIMDTCREFNPATYLSQFSSDDPFANIGLKLVSLISDEMKYQRFMGINSVTIIKQLT